jgi:CRISPR-associated protein Cas8b1/Cst1 subtype I-B
MSEIALYPSNWLMMAGIIGFLKVVEKNYKGLEDDKTGNLIYLNGKVVVNNDKNFLEIDEDFLRGDFRGLYSEYLLSSLKNDYTLVNVFYNNSFLAQIWKKNIKDTLLWLWGNKTDLEKITIAEKYQEYIKDKDKNKQKSLLTKINKILEENQLPQNKFLSFEDVKKANEIFQEIENSWENTTNKQKIELSEKLREILNKTEKLKETINNEINKIINNKSDNNNLKCFFCNERNAILRDGKQVILDESHFTPLSASHKEFQNMFWEGKSNLFLCLPCELIIYCAAFAFTKFGNSYYFINAPATIEKVKEINNVWGEWFGNQNQVDETRVFQNSIIEVLKLAEKKKAKWSIQNISIIKLEGEKNTFDVYTMNISEDVANAMRKMIQAYPNSLKEVYDIFLYYVYERKPLYSFVDTIFYGFLTKEKMKLVDRDELTQYIQGKLLYNGIKLNNIKDLLFFLKFQREVEKYGK